MLGGALPRPEYEPWMDDALCAQTDPDLFFPDLGGSAKAAKAVCAGCDVAAECLAYALEHGEREGIWGGLSPLERRKLERGAAA
jgi:WhiB family redox-sensing transcriptional regulator